MSRYRFTNKDLAESLQRERDDLRDELQMQRDFFLRWLCEVRRTLTRQPWEDGRTDAELLDDLSNLLSNFGADSFTEEQDQVNEHDRLMALPRTYDLETHKRVTT